MGLGREGLQVRVAVEEVARCVVVDPRKYADLELGSAVTTHKAQGATLETAQVFMGEEVASLALGYVQASRSRGGTGLFMGAEVVPELRHRWSGSRGRPWRGRWFDDPTEACQDSRRVAKLRPRPTILVGL